METHDHHGKPEEEPMPVPYWKSRAGIYLIVALALGGLLLGYEHRVHIFASEWVLFLPLLLCVGMHFFMHGGHGSGDDKS
ncbi:DUF2933 domain-containing protein [Leisingera aquimarina]|uniref:DUF2933 domain-containing protein n=1 Tax=Leisingera aquimarina TaxID=476529 RepID=UPI0004111217|nr:DUF2933 domain-containing protein [Leisingera aquimarina]